MNDRLDRLVRNCAPDVLAYLVRRVVDAEDAADLLGDVFVALASRPARIPEDATEARMWAFGVARRVFLAHRRRAHTELVEAETLRGLLLAENAQGHDDDVDRLFARDAVDALPPRQREVVILVHWDGFTLADAAKHLGIRASTARALYQRARESLRVGLSEPSKSMSSMLPDEMRPPLRGSKAAAIRELSADLGHG